MVRTRAGWSVAWATNPGRLVSLMSAILLIVETGGLSLDRHCVIAGRDWGTGRERKGGRSIRLARRNSDRCSIVLVYLLGCGAATAVSVPAGLEGRREAGGRGAKGGGAQWDPVGAQWGARGVATGESRAGVQGGLCVGWRQGRPLSAAECCCFALVRFALLRSAFLLRGFACWQSAVYGRRVRAGDCGWGEARAPIGWRRAPSSFPITAGTTVDTLTETYHSSMFSQSFSIYTIQKKKISLFNSLFLFNFLNFLFFFLLLSTLLSSSSFLLLFFLPFLLQYSFIKY